MFVYNGETYNNVAGIQNFNHVLQDLTFFNSTAEITTICITIVIYYTQVSFKYRCIDSLKWQTFTETCRRK